MLLETMLECKEICLLVICSVLLSYRGGLLFVSHEPWYWARLLSTAPSVWHILFFDWLIISLLIHEFFWHKLMLLHLNRKILMNMILLLHDFVISNEGSAPYYIFINSERFTADLDCCFILYIYNNVPYFCRFMCCKL